MQYSPVQLGTFHLLPDNILHYQATARTISDQYQVLPSPSSEGGGGSRNTRPGSSVWSRPGPEEEVISNYSLSDYRDNIVKVTPHTVTGGMVQGCLILIHSEDHDRVTSLHSALIKQSLGGGRFPKTHLVSTKPGDDPTVTTILIRSPPSEEGD